MKSTRGGAGRPRPFSLATNHTNVTLAPARAGPNLQPMPPILYRLLSDERAATAIEYSLIAVLISLAGIVSLTRIGQRLVNFLEQVAAGYP